MGLSVFLILEIILDLDTCFISIKENNYPIQHFRRYKFVYII